MLPGLGLRRLLLGVRPRGATMRGHQAFALAAAAAFLARLGLAALFARPLAGTAWFALVVGAATAYALARREDDGAVLLAGLDRWAAALLIAGALAVVAFQVARPQPYVLFLAASVFEVVGLLALAAALAWPTMRRTAGSRQAAGRPGRNRS